MFRWLKHVFVWEVLLPCFFLSLGNLYSNLQVVVLSGSRSQSTGPTSGPESLSAKQHISSPPRKKKHGVLASRENCVNFLSKTKNYLVVEPPIWKIWSSNWITSPGKGEKKKYLKQPPRKGSLVNSCCGFFFIFAECYPLLFRVSRCISVLVIFDQVSKKMGFQFPLTSIGIISPTKNDREKISPFWPMLNRYDQTHQSSKKTKTA